MVAVTITKITPSELQDLIADIVFACLKRYHSANSTVDNSRKHNDEELVNIRYAACEKLAKKYDGKNLLSLLLAATYLGESSFK